MPTSSQISASLVPGLVPFAMGHPPGGNVGSQDSIVSRCVEKGSVHAGSNNMFSLEQVFTCIQQLQERVISFQQQAQAHHTGYASYSNFQARAALQAMEFCYEQMVTEFRAQLIKQAQADLAQIRVRPNAEYLSELNMIQSHSHQTVQQFPCARDEANSRAELISSEATQYIDQDDASSR